MPAVRSPIPLAAALALALATALAAPAGAAQPPSGLAALASAKVCCEDPGRFPYEKLAAGESREFAIDRRSPAFEFQTGRSFFRAFELPAGGSPYTLELQSYVEGPPSPRDARVFYPVVAVLTDDFIVSRSTDLDHLRFDLPMLERTRAPAYRLSVPLDPANPRERYLVVFTPAALLAPRDLSVASPDAARPASREAYLGASAFGRLRVTLRPTPAPEPETPAAAPATDATDATTPATP